MSVQDSAAALIAAGENFLGNAISTSTAAATSLGAAADTIALIGDMVIESMATSTNLLGAGYGGMAGIGASANAVSHKADEVRAAIQQAITMILDLDQAIGLHAGNMTQVGHALMQGGS